MLLADLGATVVKVERPGSGDDTRAWGPPYAADGQSTYFQSVNRNKASIALDLGDPADRAIALAIAARADVRGGEPQARFPDQVRPGLRPGPRGQPRGRVLLDQRLRLRHRARPARLRPARPGDGRPHEHHRHDRADEGRRRGRRRPHRAPCGRRHPRSAAPPRPHRRRSAAGSHVAVEPAVEPGQPGVRVRRRRLRARLHGQRPPVDRALRSAGRLRPSDGHRGRERRAVRSPGSRAGPVRGCRRCTLRDQCRPRGAPRGAHRAHREPTAGGHRGRVAGAHHRRRDPVRADQRHRPGVRACRTPRAASRSSRSPTRVEPPRSARWRTR